MAASGRQGAPAALSRVRPYPRRPDALSFELRGQSGYRCPGRGRNHGTPAHHRRHPLDRGGQHHACSACPIAREPRLRSSTRSPTRAATSTRSSRTSRCRRAGTPRSPSPSPRRISGLPRRRSSPVARELGIAADRHRQPDRQGLDRRCRHALPSRRRCQGVRHAGRGGDQHRDDLDLPDQDLLRHPVRSGARRRSARCTAPSSSRLGDPAGAPARPGGAMNVRPRVAVVGATGVVGGTMLELLDERELPSQRDRALRLRALRRAASSHGRTVLPLAPRDDRGLRHRSVLSWRRRRARVGSALRSRRGGRDRQLLGLPPRSRGAARRR